MTDCSEITREGGESRLRITMNPEILREVLEALLKNGVKNTPDGVRIASLISADFVTSQRIARPSPPASRIL